jgi:hypothetical protein
MILVWGKKNNTICIVVLSSTGVLFFKKDNYALVVELSNCGKEAFGDGGVRLFD